MTLLGFEVVYTKPRARAFAVEVALRQAREAGIADPRIDEERCGPMGRLMVWGEAPDA